MKCRNPYLKAGRAYPCGQCMPCRFNARRVWSHRMMLEAALREDNAFVTLTYDDASVPRLGDKPDGLPTLKPVDVQLWLKRMRKAFEPERFRYYLVGEYGDVTERPHYHVALFGYPTCSFGRSRYRYRDRCCIFCDRVLDTWAKGAVDVGTLSVESAQYIAGYVTKKMTRKDDLRLNGRYPEFARMSLRPGIGADFMHDVASSLLEHNLEDLPDVPGALRHGRRILPIGRYLRRRLRTLVGKEANAPQETLDEASAEVRAVWEAEWSNPSRDFGARVKKALTAIDDGRVLQMEGRAKLKRRKVL